MPEVTAHPRATLGLLMFGVDEPERAYLYCVGSSEGGRTMRSRFIVGVVIVAMLFVGVGWGKPVQIDATKLKPNPKVGMALVDLDRAPFARQVVRIGIIGAEHEFVGADFGF